MPTGIYIRTPEQIASSNQRLVLARKVKAEKGVGGWKVKDTSNMRGRVPKSAFKKGCSPWNKGTKGLVKAWNKGLKGAQVGWNKGTVGLMPRPHNKIGDGITSQSKLERAKFRKTTQMLVFQRDDFTCQMCDQRGGNLQVDHKKSWSQYPELRFDIDNCRTLCMACHYFVTFKKKIPLGIVWGHNLSRGIAS